MRRPGLERKLAAALGLVVLLWVACVPAAFAGPLPVPAYGFQQALYASPPQADAHFGRSVAISGDTIVVGEPDRLVPVPGTTGIRSGAVSVYVRSAGTWTLQAQLRPVLTHAGDEFGAAVAIDGDTVVVGSPNYLFGGQPTGTAFVYSRTGSVWSAPTQLTPAAAGAGGMYGAAVAIDGTTIAVGAPGENGNRGVVAVFALSGGSWGSQYTLADPAPMTGDFLGGSVAVLGDTIFAGATGDTYQPGGALPVVTAGAVHVFKRSQVAPWVYGQTLYSPAPHAAELFGGPIAASGSRMLASAWEPMGSEGQIGPGVVYAFAESGGAWSYETSLAAPVPEPAGYFGSGVGLDGDSAVVGAFFSDSYRGRAYFYSHSSGSWQLIQQVEMSGFHPGVVQLGTSAGLSGDTAVLGAQMAFAPTVATPGSGGAYVFKSPATLWGMVTDAATHLPLTGIEMSAYVPGQGGDPDLVGMTNSDANGLYALSLPAGDYGVGWMDATDTYRWGFYNEAQTWWDATMLALSPATPTRLDVALHKSHKVWRFYNFRRGVHFYTANEIEKNSVMRTLSSILRYEGVAYDINLDNTANGAPLYRFYNFRKGVHFYTADPNEKLDVERRFAWTLRYEGIAYDVCLSPVAGAQAVHRFYNFKTGTHFYTASLAEKLDVERRFAWTLRYEGIAYYLAP